MKFFKIALLSVILGFACMAQESTDKPDWDKIVKDIAGTQVIRPKTDAKGNYVSVVVVGIAPISKVGGVEHASRRAKLQAEAAFVGWLQKNVSQVITDETGVVVSLQAKGDDMQEEGKEITNTTTLTKSQCEGVVRGMELIHSVKGFKDEADGRMKCGLVFGWTAKHDKAARKVYDEVNAPSKQKTKVVLSKQKKTETKDNKENKPTSITFGTDTEY